MKSTTNAAGLRGRRAWGCTWKRPSGQKLRRVLQLVEQRRLLRERFEPCSSRPRAPAPERRLDRARGARFSPWASPSGSRCPTRGGSAPGPGLAASPPPAGLPARAARAHLVYAVEVRHPGGGGRHAAGAPRGLALEAAGHEAQGAGARPRKATSCWAGACFPGPKGRWRSSCTRRRPAGASPSTFPPARRARGRPPSGSRRKGKVSVFYWIDGNWGYALSGEMDRPALSRISSSVYRQLNP